MVDVTKENFDVLKDDILSDIKSSSFIAIDTEFTGLLVDSAYKNSLFDNGAQRYQKLRANFQRVTVCQMGLSIFKGVLHSNEYAVTTYNFYLRPCTSVSYDPTFICQTSSIDFLRRFNFDFNKWLYGGIYFMNDDAAKMLQSDLLAILKGERVTNLSFEARDHLSEVGSWAASAEEGSTMTLNLKDNHSDRFFLRAMIHLRFDDLLSEDYDGEVIIKKVSVEERATYVEKDPDGNTMVKDHIAKLRGFTVIFQQLAKYRKPLIFHNGLLDLMLVYKEFYQDLPESYEEFKSNLHGLFPLIYDTKYIATKLKKHFKEKSEPVSHMLGNTGLLDLATNLRKEVGVLYRPTISHLASDKYLHGDFHHEAGYDAFLTGYCFLSLSHIYAMLQLPSGGHRPMSPREHVFSLKAFSNEIMVQRASIQYMNLCGTDAKPKRPPWLLVEGRYRMKISPGIVYAALAQYGSVDVIPRNQKSVLVASSSWECTRDILKNLGTDSPLRAVRYSRLKHSPLTRTLAWSGALLSTGLSVWFLYSTLKKSS
ncbi:pre-piRNA 3'-exonuclease trimmer-like isoform X2 [Palaemon carinicauda]|uniref:pre-piRNA 3'-exonuclease trimmer-like isoform X2 n=1 Tax=Palaemon carinicauda TaxID=392227 RepID=UPI0035B58548